VATKGEIGGDKVWVGPVEAVVGIAPRERDHEVIEWQKTKLSIAVSRESLSAHRLGQPLNTA
jgi:hypothetical protein